MGLINATAMLPWAASFKVVRLQCEYCRRSIALRQMSARKAGIRMRAYWYCSSSCFVSAAEDELSGMLRVGSTQARLLPTVPLGETLVSRGLVARSQLREIAARQREVGGDLGDLLVREGQVSEKDVMSARAGQWGCPVFSVEGHVAQPKVRIPSTLLRLCSALPLHYTEATNALLVGFVHSIEYALLYAIEQVTGCKTQPCFITSAFFEAQILQREWIEKNREEESSKEVRFEAAQSPSEIARILCAHGIQYESDEAVIGKCRDFVWIRLKSGSSEVDLLFRTA